MASHRQFWGYLVAINYLLLCGECHLHFVKFPLWQQFPAFVTLQETSRIRGRMRGRSMCLEHSVPPLNSIICSWKLVICAVKHIPKIDWKCWYTSWSIDTEPPNTIILEVVQNSVCSIYILTANLVKAASWSNEFSTSFDGTNTTALIIWRCKQILDHLCSVEWVSEWVSEWMSEWVRAWCTIFRVR